MRLKKMGDGLLELEKRAIENASETFERIKKNVEEEMKLEDIRCPYCDAVQSNEIKYQFVTYWGEEPAGLCSCENCDKTFEVKEEVERHFICTKIEEKEE